MRKGLAIYADGCRIFYVLGVLKFFFEKDLQFDVIATYSAGSAVLPVIVAGDFDRAVGIFAPLMEANTRNAYIENLFSSEDVFPHDGIYTQAVAEVLEPDRMSGFGKPLRVVVSEFQPRLLGAELVAFCGLAALFLHEMTRGAGRSIFLKAFKRLFSIGPAVIDIRRCASREEVATVILGSSTIYPFIRVRERGGRPMLDGLMSLHGPVGALSDCDLVLSVHPEHPSLSSLTSREGLFSAFPLSKVRLGALDFVGSADMKEAYAQGYAEGREHYDRLKETPFFRAQAA